MDSENKVSRVLGIAFLLQFITSFTSGVFLWKLLIANENIVLTLTNIANNQLLTRICIFIDMLTVLGVTFLGIILFVTLRKQNEKMALCGLFFYLIEAVLLAFSRIGAFSLIIIAKEFVLTGNPSYLLSLGNIAIGSMNFAGNASMLAFCTGAILFYYLLFKSRIVPRGLSLWGLITVLPCLVATISKLLGYEMPFIIYFPYVPFELFIGIWILIKGVKEQKIIEGVIK